MGKKFQDLDLSNAYLFAAAMQDEETCRLVLQTIIEKEIKKVKVHAEHTMFYSSDFRSVRLDIYARDEAEVGYNIEMQNTNKKNLAKRSRFYQAEMDITSLKHGEDYEQLKPSYIVFICTFDPFGKGLYKYTFESYCKRADVYLEDETQRIFISTKGKDEADVSPELIHFLRYIENSTDEVACQNADDTVNYLHNRVRGLKRNRELEVGYMRLEEMLNDKKEEGKLEGRIESLIELLSELGDIPESIQGKIRQEDDIQTLSKWTKLAASVNSVDEFKAQM